jgi:tetratricopeptide (TPR) repeat protein
VAVVRYWKADTFFATAKNTKVTTGNLISSQDALLKATKLSPKEAIFRSELAENSVDIALALVGQEKSDQAQDFITKAIQNSDFAQNLSPQNLSVLRQRAATFIKLSQYDPQSILIAVQTLEKTATLAPTDAKIIYNLGLVYIRTGENQKAQTAFQKAVELKSNYREARLALGSIYAQLGKIQEAKTQFEYLLNINPNDTVVKSERQKLK